MLQKAQIPIITKKEKKNNMPNYCNNRITFAKDVNIKPFITADEFGVVSLDFNKIIPMREEDIDDGANCITAWGTKWGTVELSGVDDENCVRELNFDTAWTPPLPVVGKLSHLLGCAITITYYESGMCFAGEAIANNGIVKDNCVSEGVPLYAEIANSFGDEYTD